MDKEYEKKATAYYQGINQQLFSLIDPKVEMVLDIGCAEGALGAAIKAAYGADVHGFELFQHAAVQAEKKLDSVTVGNIESDPLPFEHDQFDAIIFADVLEHTLDPWSVLAKVKPYLKKPVPFTQASQMSVIYPLLRS
ncbi:O-antigen biosynthesis protein RfbC [Bacillus sp. JCM 19047]|nr:O-antigen biosynthesis protein RfbC [Bacillus sp. JCM 19047]